METNTNTLPKKLNSTNSIDQTEPESREITLNGFNRFDPKYISIGPKQLRESSFSAASAAANKCATLRHGGRYGGGLGGSVDKGAGPTPQLKKAQPPSVSTVSKEYLQSSPLPPPPKHSSVSTFESAASAANATLPNKKSIKINCVDRRDNIAAAAESLNQQASHGR